MWFCNGVFSLQNQSQTKSGGKDIVARTADLKIKLEVINMVQEFKKTFLDLLLFSCILSAGIQDVLVKLLELKESRCSALQNIQIAMFKI